MNNPNQLVEQLNIKDSAAGRSKEDNYARGQHSQPRQRDISDSKDSFKVLTKLATQLKALAGRLGSKETAKANEQAKRTRMKQRLKEPPKAKIQNPMELKQMELVIPKKSIRRGTNPKTGKSVYQGAVALAQDNIHPSVAKEHVNLNGRVKDKSAYNRSVSKNPYADKFDGVDNTTRFSAKAMRKIIEANKDADPNSDFYIVSTDVMRTKDKRMVLKADSIKARTGPDGETQDFNLDSHNQKTSFARRKGRMLDRKRAYSQAVDKQQENQTSDNYAYG